VQNQTLTLDPNQRVSGDYLSLGVTSAPPPPSPASDRHAEQTDRASHALVSPSPPCGLGQKALSRIHSTAARSPLWGTRSPVRGLPAALPPPLQPPWQVSGSREVRGQGTELEGSEGKGKKVEKGAGRGRVTSGAASCRRRRARRP
jgi:hypothetical protein